MALFTKILIFALCAVAAECVNGGMGGMGMGNMMGVRYPMMRGMMFPGMMYPGMMGFKDWQESSDKPSGSSTPHPLPNSSAMPTESVNPQPWEISKAFEDVADQIRHDQPASINVKEQNEQH